MTVVLVQPVAKFTTAKAEGIKIMLTDNLLTVSEIGTFPRYESKLRRDKSLLAAFGTAFCVFLYPAQRFITRLNVGFQNMVTFGDIIGTFFPVASTRVAFAVVKVETVAARYFLLLRDKKLRLFGFADKIILKLNIRSDFYGVKQIIR